MIASAAPARGAEEAREGYFRSHLWHWVVAVGTSLADNEYEDRVGYSTDPLILADPPGVDRSWRRWLADEDYENSTLIRQRSTIAVAIGAGAAVLTNLGREGAPRRIADDLTGFAEVWLFDKGASGLMKNIVGRWRPEIEFIDDQNLTPEEREEELAKRSNHQSFYSGATSRQFSLMTYTHMMVADRVESRVGRTASFALLHGFAAYVGYSRMRADKHYLTDVLAGAAAGIVTGRMFYKAHHRESGGAHDAHRPEPRVRLSSVSAVPGGVVVMFSVTP